MGISTFPAITPTALDDFQPGQWAFVRQQIHGEPYYLAMMTDKPCDDYDSGNNWLLSFFEGAAGFTRSTSLHDLVARIDGDIRAPLPIAHDHNETAQHYQPGFLYASISKKGLQLVAQLQRSKGACVVGLDGVGMSQNIPSGADLQRIERVEYRARGDDDWYELVRVDQPFQA